MRRRQNDGAWFVNVCNVDSYIFKLITDNGTKECSRLSLGAQGL